MAGGLDMHLDGQYEWIYILSVIVAFVMAWGIGANDVANSFGTSVGSGAVSMKQAVIIAWVFEFSGAFFMGGRVAETIKGGIANPKDFLLTRGGQFDKHGAGLLMWGMFIALVAAAAWITVATFYGMPISTTHSIVGSIIGFSMVARGADSITWFKEDKHSDIRVGGFASIVVSWVLTPLIAALLSIIVFSFTKTVLLRPKDSERRTLLALPFYYAFTAFVITFFIVYKGSGRLKLSNIGNAKATWIAVVVGAVVFVLARLLVVPMAKRRLEGLEERKAAVEEAKARRKAFLDGAFTTQSKCAGDHDAAEKGVAAAGAKAEQLPPASACSEDEPKSTWETLKAWYFLAESKTIAHDLEFTEHTLELHSKAEIFDERAEELFSFLQVLTACAAAFAHGTNDTANAIGPLSSVYTIYTGDAVAEDARTHKLSIKTVEVEVWMLAMGGIAIGFGFAVWGWRMVRNLGGAVTKMTASRGFTAELCAALTVVVASRFGMPISTTHTLVGATIGVGASDNWRNVDWKLFGQFVMSWVVTILFAAFLTAALFSFTVYSPCMQV